MQIKKRKKSTRSLKDIGNKKVSNAVLKWIERRPVMHDDMMLDIIRTISHISFLVVAADLCA